MSRVWYVAKGVLLGLCVTQVLAALHVYISDTNLYRTLQAVQEAGYLIIPNLVVAPTLREWGVAFWGGCFFTLSLGAGLSLISVVLAWIWRSIFVQDRTGLVLIIVLWLALVLAMNRHGFSMMVTAYFLIVPLSVFIATLHWMPTNTNKKKWLNSLLIPWLPIALLTVIGTIHADRYLFLNIRDFLLLSNSGGQKVNDFYYRYTLYPAQVLKTLQQKTIKTCQVVSMKEKEKARRLEDILIDNDYLPVATKAPADLRIMATGDRLELKHKGRIVLQIPWATFTSHPRKVLEDFSLKADRNRPLRQAIMFGLFAGFPVLLYVMVFGLIHFVAGFLISPARSMIVAASLCFFVGLALLAPLNFGRSERVSAGQVPGVLNALSWQQRVLGLRAVVDQKLEIARFPSYRQILTSPHLPERYWLAKALGISRRPDTLEAIKVMLDDPDPNVVCMAFFALGQRGDRQAVEEILKKIETSDHWYSQWYAYRALRALGWKQKRTNPDG